VASHILSIHIFDGGGGILGAFVFDEGVLSLHEDIANGAKLIEGLAQVFGDHAARNTGDVHGG